jgi:hypothetical protein
MCNCDVSEPKVYGARLVFARKSHRCCECGGEIAPGQPYEMVSGLWDERWGNFKTCTPCAEDRQSLECQCVNFGQLRDAYAEEVGWSDVWHRRQRVLVIEREGAGEPA